MTVIRLHRRLGHVHGFPAHGHFVRLVPAGAEQGSPVGENSGKDFRIERQRTVLHQSSESVPESGEPHSISGNPSATQSADRGIQSGTISSAGKYADMLHEMEPREWGDRLHHILMQFSRITEVNFHQNQPLPMCPQPGRDAPRNRERQGAGA